jgi:16S rRNA A1518/A1519 N6-dimethyltransferase RsmA/KsgA/DIM1 with predicted DNA glycosylase/AP lyase activity
MLGCRNLTAIDYDQDLIIALRRTIEKFCPESDFKIFQGDILSEKL